MNKMNTWAFSISMNLSIYLMHSLFFQLLKKNVSGFPVPSAHLSMEPGWAEARVGARCHPLWCPGAEEVSGSCLPLAERQPCKQAGCGSSALVSLPFSTAASPLPAARLDQSCCSALLCKALPKRCLTCIIKLRAWLMLALLPRHSWRSRSTSPAL